MVPVTCFITVQTYEIVCSLNCADFALDIGFSFGLIFRIVFVKNCVDKPFGYIRALGFDRVLRYNSSSA